MTTGAGAGGAEYRIPAGELGNEGKEFGGVMRILDWSFVWDLELFGAGNLSRMSRPAVGEITS